MKKLQSLLTSLGRHDPGTFEHCQNVALLMSKWAQNIATSAADIHKAYVCGLVHDIGKLNIPGDLLTKPGPLTDQEWKIIKSHPDCGSELIANVCGLDEISPIILFHHERYDGNGYGRGLKSTSIPLFSRMVAICDAFDAMTSKRAYNRHIITRQALDEIIRCAGSQFDPWLCQSFISLTTRDNEMRVKPLEGLALYVLHHHERWDGAGLP